MTGIGLWVAVGLCLFFYGWISNLISKRGRELTRRALVENQNPKVEVAVIMCGAALAGLVLTILFTWLILYLTVG